MKKTNYTFALLIKAAKSALEDAERTEDGRFWKCLHTLVMTAFSLEAFLNHVGAEVSDAWSDIERSLSPREKVEHLLEGAGKEASWGERPYQSFATLFRCRNELAHGRTETIATGRRGTPAVKWGDVVVPGKKWEAICTDLRAVRLLYDDARDLMRRLSLEVLGKPVDLNCGWSASGSQEL